MNFMNNAVYMPTLFSLVSNKKKKQRDCCLLCLPLDGEAEGHKVT